MTDDANSELVWSRRQLDEIAAENLRLTDIATRAQRELEVRRRGFKLLSGLGPLLGAHVELKPALAASLPIVEAALQVDKVVALERDHDVFVPFAWTGYRAEEAKLIAAARIPLPPGVLDAGVLITSDSTEQSWLPAARAGLGVPLFAAAPAGSTETVLVAGRSVETSAYFSSKLAPADVDTLYAVGKLVAAAVENAQLVALSEVKRFLPPQLVEELVSGRLRAEQGHERRVVTLLAADMVGFTRLADQLDPDRLADLLNLYLQEMTSLAHAHGGTVGSLAGDGVLVIFGAPETMSERDQAWAGVQTAFAMPARLATVATGANPEIQIRIGLSTGSCAVGVFGSSTQRTYTAIGLPVNLAARLEAAAQPGEVLASETTLALLAGRVITEPRADLSLKGFARPVSAGAIIDV